SHFKAAILLFDRLRPDPDSAPRLVAEAAMCCQWLAKFERRLGDFEAALAAAALAVDQFKTITTFHPRLPGGPLLLPRAHESLGTTKGKAGRWKGALRAYKDAEAELAEMSRISPTDLRCEHLLSGIQRNQEVTKRRLMRDEAGKATEPIH